MKTSYVSNLAIQTAMRMTIQQNQMDLLKATRSRRRVGTTTSA